MMVNLLLNMLLVLTEGIQTVLSIWCEFETTETLYSNILRNILLLIFSLLVLVDKYNSIIGTYDVLYYYLLLIAKLHGVHGI